MVRVMMLLILGVAAVLLSSAPLAEGRSSSGSSSSSRSSRGPTTGTQSRGVRRSGKGGGEAGPAMVQQWKEPFRLGRRERRLNVVHLTKEQQEKLDKLSKALDRQHKQARKLHKKKQQKLRQQEQQQEKQEKQWDLQEEGSSLFRKLVKSTSQRLRSSNTQSMSMQQKLQHFEQDHQQHKRQKQQQQQQQQQQQEVPKGAAFVTRVLAFNPVNDPMRWVRRKLARPIGPPPSWEKADLIEFHTRTCEYCEYMEPFMDKIEREQGKKFLRLLVTRKRMSMEMSLFRILDRYNCDGMPFYYNPRTRQSICGATTWDNFVYWATDRFCMQNVPPPDEIDVRAEVQKIRAIKRMGWAGKRRVNRERIREEKEDAIWVEEQKMVQADRQRRKELNRLKQEKLDELRRQQKRNKKGPLNDLMNLVKRE